MTTAPPVERTFAFAHVSGVSREALDLHIGLYRGYVRQVAILRRQADALSLETGSNEGIQLRRGAVDQRLAFELNGLLLHELFFEQLDGLPSDSDPSPGTPILEAITASFQSLDAWRKDVMRLSQTRGIGWVASCLDPRTGLLGNHWIGEHHLGVPLGHQPIAVFDLWEHAYLPDHVDGGREIYMATLFRNVDWSVLDRRLGANVQ
jgi:superoxide dismutase, Fe-Mn family